MSVFGNDGMFTFGLLLDDDDGEDNVDVERLGSGTDFFGGVAA